jgi:hypothetical protein
MAVDGICHSWAFVFHKHILFFFLLFSFLNHLHVMYLLLDFFCRPAITLCMDYTLLWQTLTYLCWLVDPTWGRGSGTSLTQPTPSSWLGPQVTRSNRQVWTTGRELMDLCVIILYKFVCTSLYLLMQVWVYISVPGAVILYLYVTKKVHVCYSLMMADICTCTKLKN